MKINSPILSLKLELKCLEEEIKNYVPPISNYEKELSLKNKMIKEYKLAINILEFWQDINNK